MSADIQEQLLIAFEAVRGSGRVALRGAESGRYANRVRVASPSGSTFDGRSGRVVRVEGDTVFVRIQVGARHAAVLPFAASELEVEW